MANDASPLRFRIEILKETKAPERFFARLCRWELFQLNPSSSESEKGQLSTEEILIEDAFWDWKGNPARSAEAALEALVKRLTAQFQGVTFE
jgi:hypothetical protein